MKMSKMNGEHYKWGMDCDGWRLVSKPDMSVIHETMPPHTEEVKHLHHKARQFFFVLQGEADMELDGQRFTLGEKEGIEIAPGVPHRFVNPYDKEVEFLVISSPSTRGDRVDCKESENG